MVQSRGTSHLIGTTTNEAAPTGQYVIRTDEDQVFYAKGAAAPNQRVYFTVHWIVKDGRKVLRNQAMRVSST